MKKLDLIKAGAEILVSTGIGSIVGNAIKQTTNPEANRFTRISIAVGGFVLSSMVSDLATKHVNAIIDDVADKVREILRSDEAPEDEGEADESEYLADRDQKDKVIDKEEIEDELLPKEGNVEKKDSKEGAKE